MSRRPPTRFTALLEDGTKVHRVRLLCPRPDNVENRRDAVIRAAQVGNLRAVNRRYAFRWRERWVVHEHYKTQPLRTFPHQTAVQIWLQATRRPE